MKRLLFPFAIALAMLALPAHAHKGCAVGGHIGSSVAHSAFTTVPASPFVDDGSAVSGAIAVSFECNVHLSSSGFYVGAAADFALLRRLGDKPAILAGAATGTEPDKRAAIVGRLGYMLSEKTAVYGEAGWGWAWDEDLEVPTANLSFGMPRYQGLVVGGGIDRTISGNIRMSLGYRATFYNDEDTTLAPGIALNREPQDHTVMLGIKIGFGAPAAAAAQAKPLK